MPHTPGASSAANEPARGHALSLVLAHAHDLTFAFQPICDLRNGLVVGYEALARLPGGGASTEDWLRWSSRCGRRADLEAALLRAALTHRPLLPYGCYVSVNISPSLLLDEAVHAALDGAGELTDVVLELTEDEPLERLDELAAAVTWLRDRGARIALDDVGARYAGLTWVMELRPEFVKLDRVITHAIDEDVAKQALAEALGVMATRLDGTVVAEGIETADELEALIALGVPLGQGYLCGRPTPAPAPIDPVVADHINFVRARARLLWRSA